MGDGTGVEPGNSDFDKDQLGVDLVGVSEDWLVRRGLVSLRTNIGVGGRGKMG